MVPKVQEAIKTGAACSSIPPVVPVLKASGILMHVGGAACSLQTNLFRGNQLTRSGRTANTPVPAPIKVAPSQPFPGFFRPYGKAAALRPVMTP